MCVRWILLHTVNWMSLESVTARLPRDMLAEVERLAQEEKVDRSELIRRLPAHALRQRKTEAAVAAYREGKVTLWKAAEIAGISLREMLEIAGARRIPVPYMLEDLRRDIEYVREKTGGK